MRSIAVTSERARALVRALALALPLALACALVLGGCVARGAHEPQSRAASSEAARSSAATAGAGQQGSALPPLASLPETATPELAVREWALPPGGEVADNTDRLAAYALNTGRPYPSSVLGLLDLDTGRHRTVLAEPVRSADSFDALAPMLSDDWFVWEEVSPGEANAFRDAEWRLYAARIDRHRLRIGDPVLVDEGATDFKLRPHYGVEGSMVYWSATTVPSSRQEYVATSGSVQALDLASGARRTLYQGSRPILALKSSGSYVIAILAPDADAACSVLVVDASSGAPEVVHDLGTRVRPSHFADYANDWLAWTPFAVPGAEWPDLYLRAPDGAVMRVDAHAIDPAFFDRFAVYESVSATKTAGGIVRHTREIRGLDFGEPTPARFPLLETGDGEGWWQTTRAGRTARTLVLWNDLGPWVEDQTRARMLVRVYRTPAQGEERRR